MDSLEWGHKPVGLCGEKFWAISTVNVAFDLEKHIVQPFVRHLASRVVLIRSLFLKEGDKLNFKNILIRENFKYTNKGQTFQK